MSGIASAQRLIVVTSSFPIRNDGSEAAGSFVADVVEALSKHVRVAVVAPGTADADERWSERIAVRRYAAPSRPLSTLRLWHPSDIVTILRVLRSGAAATRTAISDDASHVLALWGLPCGEWARRASTRAGIGYSVWLLGTDVWSLGRVPILRSMLSRVIRGASRAYADGYRLAADARRLSGREPEFLPSTREIIARDAPPRRVEPPFRLLFLGRWHPNKGVDVLLDALALLSDADWGRIERVDIEGGGPLEAPVRERVRALRANGRPVEAGGFLDKHAASSAISACDWLLIPSRIESIPVVFSDAMKLLRPVIATPVGDLPRLLRECRCGVLCERADAAAFADGLRIALDGARVDDANLRDTARMFSLDTIAAELLRERDAH